MIMKDFFESIVLSRLPSSSYSIRDEPSADGIWHFVCPTKCSAAEMGICINEYGTCDVSLGRFFGMELELTEDDKLLRIAEAVIDGQVVETVWRIKKFTLYTKSVIGSGASQFSVASGIPLPYPRRLGKTYRYDPY